MALRSPQQAGSSTSMCITQRLVVPIIFFASALHNTRAHLARAAPSLRGENKALCMHKIISRALSEVALYPRAHNHNNCSPSSKTLIYRLGFSICEFVCAPKSSCRRVHPAGDSLEEDEEQSALNQRK